LIYIFSEISLQALHRSGVGCGVSCDLRYWN
jgi:hypothetical protein